MQSASSVRTCLADVTFVDCFPGPPSFRHPPRNHPCDALRERRLSLLGTLGTTLGISAA